MAIPAQMPMSSPILISLGSFPGLKYIHYITNFPKPLRHARRHGWRHPQRLMNADKIVGLRGFVWVNLGLQA
jgi:hypothetical protein